MMPQCRPPQRVALWQTILQRTQNTFGNSASTAYNYDNNNGIFPIAHRFVGTGAQAGVTMTYTRDYSEQRTEDAASVTTYMYHPPAAGTTTYTPNNLNQYGAINGNTLGHNGSSFRAHNRRGRQKTQPV